MSMLPSWWLRDNMANILTVNGLALDGRPLNMWVDIQLDGTTVKAGLLH